MPNSTASKKVGSHGEDGGLVIALLLLRVEVGDEGEERLDTGTSTFTRRVVIAKIPYVY